jgi:toxin FitB
MSDYLVDTNILIHVLAGDLPAGARMAVERIVSAGFSVSVITRIEFLGWRGHTADGYEAARTLIECARQHLLTAPVADRAIALRRSCGISLPDAVIAATALESDSTLVTRNVRDFRGVVGLQVLNPFDETG